MFGILCQLERFDLSGNPALDQTTLVGYLACTMGGTMANLKDARRIDVSNKGLKGECALCVEPVLHVTSNDCFLCRAGELPLSIGRLKAKGCSVDLTGNQGFTLSAFITDVLNDTKLDFSDCCIQGRSVRVVFTITHAIKHHRKLSPKNGLHLFR